MQLVHDPKRRLIAAPAIIDRVLQNALLSEIAPVYECGFIDHSYACRRGRGPLRAALFFLACTRRYRYRLTLDIRRYFASIDRHILYSLLARRLHDRDTLRLLRMLIEVGGEVYRSPLAIETLRLDTDPLPDGCGMPLGSYLSHWSGGLYLDGLDHYVKRVLKVHGYLRYMDDMTLFGDDRGLLEEHHEAIRVWLHNERKLSLKACRSGIVPTSQPSTFLGYRVSRAGILPGPKAKRRLKRKLAASGSLGYERLVRSLRSYRGMLLSP